MRRLTLKQLQGLDRSGCMHRSLHAWYGVLVPARSSPKLTEERAAGRALSAPLASEP